VAVLITGAAGYIGANFVRHAVDAGHEIVAIDNLSHGTTLPPESVPFYKVDIGDIGAVGQVCQRHGISAVVHFAALKSVGESQVEPLRYITENVAKTIQMIEVLRHHNVRHCVFSSSCSVYGNPEKLPVAEESPLRPESTYAWTKAALDLYLLARCTSDFRAVSLRYFNAAGGAVNYPDMTEDWGISSNLIPAACRVALLEEKPLQIFGTDFATRDGSCIRDYVHVDDLSRAHLQALEYLMANRCDYDVFNLGTGTGSTVIEVISEIERQVGKKMPVQIVGRRPGDPEAIYAKSEKARERLKWSPTHDLSSIVRTALQAYRLNLKKGFGSPD